MSETYRNLTRATSGEATGTFGLDFMRTNVTTIADCIQNLNSTGTLVPEATTAPTLLNSWANTGGSNPVASYRKTFSRTVRLNGQISGGTAPSIAFTLPSGYRPPNNLRFPVANNGAYGEVRVASTGDVTVQVGTIVDLEAIVFSITND
jgi:hypothetical protein